MANRCSQEASASSSSERMNLNPIRGLGAWVRGSGSTFVPSRSYHVRVSNLSVMGTALCETSTFQHSIACNIAFSHFTSPNTGTNNSKPYQHKHIHTHVYVFRHQVELEGSRPLTDTSPAWCHNLSSVEHWVPTPSPRKISLEGRGSGNSDSWFMVKHGSFGMSTVLGL